MFKAATVVGAGVAVMVVAAVALAAAVGVVVVVAAAVAVVVALVVEAAATAGAGVVMVEAVVAARPLRLPAIMVAVAIPAAEPTTAAIKLTHWPLASSGDQSETQVFGTVCDGLRPNWPDAGCNLDLEMLFIGASITRRATSQASLTFGTRLCSGAWVRCYYEHSDINFVA
jgi:hypothetical protein